MPRVVKETPQSNYRGLIRGAMEARGIKTIKALSDKSGIPYRTLVVRMQSDLGTDSFRLDEMERIRKVLGVFPN